MEVLYKQRISVHRLKWTLSEGEATLYRGLTVYGFLQAPHQKSPQIAALRGAAIRKNEVTMNYVCKICMTRVMADEKPN